MTWGTYPNFSTPHSFHFDAKKNNYPHKHVTFGVYDYIIKYIYKMQGGKCVKSKQYHLELIPELSKRTKIVNLNSVSEMKLFYEQSNNI